MHRFLALTATIVVASAVHAHFVFIVPDKDGTTAKIVFSDSLEPDENVDIAKVANTKLHIRGADGKPTALTADKAEHALKLKLTGDGSRVVYGMTDYGVLQRGDAKPCLLRYHPKAILGTVKADNAKVGDAVPVEIVPEVEAGKARFVLLAGGKPVADAEMTVMLPGDKKEKTMTDKEGRSPAFEAVGLLGAWARHSEAKAGEVDGKKYDEIRHYATVTVTVPNK